MFKRRESIVFITLAFNIAILKLLQLNQTDLIYELWQILHYFAFLSTAIYALYRLVKDKRQVTFLEKSKPIILGIALFVFLFVLPYGIDTDSRKEVLMDGGVDNGLNFIHFQLFTDNSFKFLNSGPFGGRIYRGRYSLTNDTLFLDNDSLHYLYPALRLIRKAANGKIYFESITTIKFKNRLYVYNDYSHKK